jgi:CubicO group peptidase (beta-lactamase class C family)
VKIPFALAVTAISGLIGLSVPWTSASANPPLARKQSAETTRAIAQTLLTEAHLPALSIAIGVEGDLVFAQAFGFADIESGERATTQTQFRAASVSKVITITGLATLMQAHRINLDAPVQTYVPSYPSKAWTLTPRELAGHTAGLTHYSSEDRIRNGPYDSVTDALSVFAHIPLKLEPGTQYSYSTHGYTLLSAEIEARQRPLSCSTCRTGVHTFEDELDRSGAAQYAVEASIAVRGCRWRATESHRS